MTFAKWIDTFIEEKEIDPDEYMEIEGPSGLNMIPVSALVAAIKSAPASERASIKDVIVRIDFVNGDVRGYFRHLAQAIAL